MRSNFKLINLFWNGIPEIVKRKNDYLIKGFYNELQEVSKYKYEFQEKNNENLIIS